ncbi:MAG: response regulator [Ignavibacteria bacterium]|nr:response regulator [Ignavibacteria bacterium]
METLNFLVIDDDKATIANIRAILSRSFPNAGLLIAFQGNEAWNLLQKNKIDIVIADYDIPEINGLELCKKVRANPKLRSIYYILTTGYVDKELKIKALEDCVDDFINKPIEYDELIAKLRAGIRVLKLQQKVIEENKLLTELATALEKQIQDTKQLAIRFLTLRMPFVGEILKKVANASVWISKLTGNFDEEDLKDIEFASYLAYLGKLCLPDEFLEKPVLTDGAPTNELMFQVPLRAKELLENIGTFENVAKIIFHIWENFDGSGIPKKLQSWQIPAPSRIIRVALDFEELRAFKKLKADEALEIIKQGARRLYDPKVVLFFEQFLLEFRELEGSMFEKPLQLQDLKEGLVVSRDVYTYSGLKLLPSGVTLTQRTIQMLISHNTTDPILGNIWVKI